MTTLVILRQVIAECSSRLVTAEPSRDRSHGSVDITANKEGYEPNTKSRRTGGTRRLTEPRNISTTPTHAHHHTARGHAPNMR